MNVFNLEFFFFFGLFIFFSFIFFLLAFDRMFQENFNTLKILSQYFSSLSKRGNDQQR